MTFSIFSYNLSVNTPKILVDLYAKNTVFPESHLKNSVINTGNFYKNSFY